MTSMTSIADLNDLAAPEPVSFMPSTAAWWVVLGLLLIGICALGYRLWRGHRANRYRREALARLAELEAGLVDPARRTTALTALPVLVKQTALACCPRDQVAELSGERWLQFLDGTLPGAGFSDGPGRLLPVLAYADPGCAAQVDDDEVRQLVQLVRNWIRRHRVRV